MVRGQQLSIALPCDYDANPDPMAFARESLPEHVELITAAEHEEILIRRTAGSSSGVAGLIGEIVTGETTSINAIMYWMSVVVVVLQYGERHRGEMPMAWPGVAFFPNGVEVK